MTPIISVIKNKGGTGKTTTSLNLGAAFANLKFEVLLIDFDSPSNLRSTKKLKEIKWFQLMV